jgi:hypothetical protein
MDSSEHSKNQATRCVRGPLLYVMESRASPEISVVPNEGALAVVYVLVQHLGRRHPT